MPRIRSIKPEFFRHESLFDAERTTGLPLRVAFAGLWTVTDREGRFRWRPRALKPDVLPYDDVDFADVLNALADIGLVVQYEVDGEVYGWIPSWKKHQAINQREAQSELPAPPDNSPLPGPGKGSNGKGNEKTCTHVQEQGTHVHAHGEREREKEQERSSPPYSPPPPETDAALVAGATVLEAGGGKNEQNGVVLPSWLDETAWHGYLEHRKKIRRPMTDYAKTLALNRLERMRAEGIDPTAVLNNTIENGWQKLVPPDHYDRQRHETHSRPVNGTRYPTLPERNAEARSRFRQAHGLPADAEPGAVIDIDAARVPARGPG